MQTLSKIIKLNVKAVNNLKVGQIIQEPLSNRNRLAKIQFFYAEDNKVMAFCCQVLKSNLKMGRKSGWFAIDVNKITDK